MAKVPIRSFRDLEVWKLGKQITLQIYRETLTFPREEVYGLTAQMRRAAVSIPSNIAEGFNRRYTRDFCKFLGIALGSCGELETQAEISGDLEFLSHRAYDTILVELQREAKMLNSLIHKLS